MVCVCVCLYVYPSLSLIYLSLPYGILSSNLLFASFLVVCMLNFPHDRISWSLCLQESKLLLANLFRGELLTCVCKGILLLLGFWTVRSSTTLATLSIITCMFESQFIMGRIFSTWQPKYCVETCSDRTECLYV